MTTKLDQADWHYGGDYPSDLPPEAGSTHIGMFFVWMIQHGLGDDRAELFELKVVEDLVASRSSSPGEIFRKICDEKLFDDYFNEESAAFARPYYNKLYINDYDAALGSGPPTLYHIADNWETFDRLKPVLDKRYDAWSGGMLKLSEEKQ